MRTHLVIIDPQNDFCDLPESYRPRLAGGQAVAPALPVPGAHADMRRVAALIDGGGAGLDQISVTLDSHHHLDIGHPTFWETTDGGPVAAFTTISAEDVRAGRYRPRWQDAGPRVLAYLEALEANRRFTHMVWPIHCEIGTWGHNIHDDVRLACNRWEESRLAIVDMVTKGTNPWTEHYSAIRAEVPDPTDEATQSNRTFLAQLRQADRVYITGEAGSHCVKATTEHIADAFGDAGDALSKLVLVTDCMSPVAGFEAPYADFLTHMKTRGLSRATSAEVVAELRSRR